MDQKLQGYVINLDRHPERLSKFNQHPDARYFQRLPAVDKKVLELLGERDYFFNTVFIDDHIDRPISFGEIGCTLSHIKAWKLIAENQLLGDNDFAIIAEDDVILVDNFSYHLKALLHLFTKMDLDLIKLQRLGVNNLYAGGAFQGFYPKKITECDDGGSALYLIRKSKTKALIKRLESEKPCWLADEFSLFCGFDKMFLASTVLGYIPDDAVSDLEEDRIISKQHNI